MAIGSHRPDPAKIYSNSRSAGVYTPFGEAASPTCKLVSDLKVSTHVAQREKLEFKRGTCLVIVSKEHHVKRIDHVTTQFRLCIPLVAYSGAIAQIFHLVRTVG